MIVDIIGIAVGRSTHTVLIPNTHDGKIEWEEELEIPNSQKGIAQVLKIVNKAMGSDGAETSRSKSGKPIEIVFSGNYKWALPFARSLCMLMESPDLLRYLGKPTEKGGRENIPSFLKNALSNGVKGGPFFLEKRPENEPDHHWWQTALSYLSAANEVRRCRHLVMSTMGALFPEAVRPSYQEIKKGRPIPEPLPPGLWTKKMRPVLENPDPTLLKSDSDVPPEIRILSEDSIGKGLTRKERQELTENHRGYLRNLDEWERAKKAAMENLTLLTKNHPLVAAFPDSESAIVLTALIGWREWKNNKELSGFAGLLPTRVDSRGKKVINRKRGPVRQYGFLLGGKTAYGKKLMLRRENKAKEEAEKAGVEYKVNKKARKVKRIEGLLRELRKEGLLSQKTAAGEPDEQKTP